MDLDRYRGKASFAEILTTTETTAMMYFERAIEDGNQIERITKHEARGSKKHRKQNMSLISCEENCLNILAGLREEGQCEFHCEGQGAQVPKLVAIYLCHSVADLVRTLHPNVRPLNIAFQIICVHWHIPPHPMNKM